MSTRAAYLGPAKRRQPILDAALELFAEGGFEDASMAAIAARAGVAKPVLYDCFPGGKDELCSVLLHQLETGFTDRLAAVLDQRGATSLRDGLEAGLAAFLEYADVNPAGFRVVFGGAESANTTVAAGALRVRESVVAHLRDRSVARLGLPPEQAVVAELFSRAIVSVAEELARWSLQRPELPRDLLVHLTGTWFVRGLEAFIPPPRSRDRAGRMADSQPPPESPPTTQ
jgi:AcrR family transcriptional regulator